MARVAVQFVASSNMGALSKDIAAINAQMAALAAQMQKLNATPEGRKQIRELQDNFRTRVNSIAGFETATMSARTMTQKLTEDIQKQRIATRDLADVRKNLGNIVDEQMRLRNSAANITGYDMANGRVMGDLIRSTDEFGRSAARTAVEAAVMGNALKSAGQNTIAAGKRMQWTGRQLAMGVTAPIVAVGLVSAKAAYDIDAAMVRLTKVYGDLGGASEEELEKVREATTQTAVEVARDFGIAGKATVTLAGDLAAAGYEGERLQKTTREIQRIALLGELDQQKAMDATRTIQTVFGISTEELANKFNYLNAVENQTNTTLQDLTEVIPRTAGVIKDLGGSLEDSAIFTVAFKEAGIDAVQGANALRSSLGAIVAPSGVARKNLLALGIDMRQIVEQNRVENGGSLVGLLQQLGTELSQLGSVERQRALATLFGRYQFNKMNGLLKSLSENANDTSTQVGRAFELASTGTAELAAAADREIAEITESLSGRLRRAGASIAMTFAELGRPILAVVVNIVEAFDGMMRAINSLPGPIKAITQTFLGLLALVGPIVFFAGIFKVLRGGVMFARGAFRLMGTDVKKLETAQDMFAKHASSVVIPAIKAETAAVAELQRAMNTLAGGMAGAALAPGGAVGTTAGRMKHPKGAVDETGKKIGGRYMTDAQMAAQRPAAPVLPPLIPPGTTQALDDAGNKTNRLAGATEKVRGNWAGIATTVLIFGPMLASLTGATGGWLTAVTAAGFVLSMYPKLLTAPVEKMLQLRKASVKSAGGFKSILGHVGKLKVLLAGIGGPLLGVIAALGIGFMAIRNNQKEIEKNNDELARSSKDMARIVGAAWSEVGNRSSEAAEKIDETANRVKEFQKVNKATVREMRAMSEAGNEAGIVKMATNIGLDVRNHGGTAEQAMEAVKIALRSASRSDLITKVKVNFADDREVTEANAQMFAERTRKILEDKFKKGWSSGIVGLFTNENTRGNLTRDQKNAANELVDNFVGQVQTGIEDPANRNLISKGMNEMMSTITPNYKLEANGVVISEEDIAIVEKYTGVQIRNNDEALRALGIWGQAADNQHGLSDAAEETARDLAEVGAVEKQMVQQTLTRLGLDAKVVEQNMFVREGFLSLADVLEYLRKQYGDAQGAQEAYNLAQREAQRGTRVLTMEEKLLLAQRVIAQYGLVGVNAEQLINNTLLGEAAEALNTAAAATEDYTEKTKKLTGALRTESTKGLNDLADIAFEMYDEQTEAGVESYETRIEASNEYYDGEKKKMDRNFEDQADALKKQENKEKKAAEEVADTRIKAIQNEVDAANELDKKREKMFQAEKTRMERLANAANRNIDFNVALRTGDLDEAARIRETAVVEEITNAMSDAGMGAETAAEQRKAVADKKIESIKTEAEAEQQRISEAFEQRKRDLDDARDKAAALLEVDKKSAADRINAQREGYAKMRAAERKALEEQTRLISERGAMNIGEWGKAAGGLQRLFDERAGILLRKSNAWNSKVANGFSEATFKARDDIANDDRWEAFGGHLADLMARGATEGQYDWDQIIDYVATGKEPPVPATTEAPQWQSHAPSAMRRQQEQLGHGYHSGGMVDGTSSSRDGRPLNAPLYPDEVPAVLQKGEYVVKRDAVKKVGVENLHRINQGSYEGADDTGRYHKGGFVTGPAIGFAMQMVENMKGVLRAAVLRRDQENLAAGVPPEKTMLMKDSMGAYGTAEGLDLGVGAAASILAALRMKESGGNYRAMNGNATGAYQYMPGTWANYRGYTRAMDAPPEVQDAKAMSDLMAAYAKFTDWRKAIAHHFYPAWANNTDLWGRSPGGNNPTVNDYVNDVLRRAGYNPAMFAAGAGPIGGDQFGAWLSAQQRMVRPDVLSRVWQGLAMVPGQQIITSGRREAGGLVAGSNRVSLHGSGRAVDVGARARSAGGTAQSEAMGDRIASVFRSGVIPGVQEVLWKTMQGGNHFDHVHVGFRHDGGPVEIPGLRTGGTVQFDDTIANLHKNETVLTAPLSAKLEKGINSLDSGGTTQYNINVYGAGADADTVANKVMQKIQRMDQVRGPKRVIRGNG